MYAFSISILCNNIWGTLFWGVSEGVVAFILFLNLKINTVPRIITDERSILIQIITVLVLTVVAALTSWTTLILITIDIILSLSVFLLERRFDEF